MDAPEGSLGFHQSGDRPAKCHGAAAPAFDVAGDTLDRAIRILDWIGGAKRLQKRAGEAESVDGEGILQTLAEGRGCGGMIGVELGDQGEQAALGLLR